MGQPVVSVKLGKDPQRCIEMVGDGGAKPGDRKNSPRNIEIIEVTLKIRASDTGH